ncbi:LAME_0G19372g1_1 [Lachancea meyersii CBS 8951]|uniref:LAME_0G19372g1_1 n=1 Tax=Lachancea meyersii CBS 8951 TaxID=1266667 RepID=A0A1G4KC46_9SACH|nr:LAME_0G19372g1_1 [Lachancea meyersii CBS 8951]
MFDLDPKFVNLVSKQSVDELKALEKQSRLPRFDYNIAFEFGCKLRQWAISTFPSKAMVIDISLPSGQCLFHTTTNKDTALDNDIWVSRKKKTAIRFGCSSYVMGQKLKAKKMNKPEDAFFIDSKEYAVHGGSVPLYVEGIDSMGAVLTVSGLKQEEDHAFALQAISEFAKSLEPSELDLD